MNGQYLCNRQITVSYAYKKDTKGERHGTPAGDSFSYLDLYLFVELSAYSLCVAERVLAASNPGAQKSRPHTLFASGPPTLPNVPQANGAMAAAPVPPRPFVNGVAPPAISTLRPPPPPQAAPFPPMQVAPQPAWHQQQPGQPIPPHMMPPPPVQQFRPPHSSMPPPPPPQAVPAPPRPLPPPAAMTGQQPMWRPPPPPQMQQQGMRPPSFPQSSMPPPPPPS